MHPLITAYRDLYNLVWHDKRRHMPDWRIELDAVHERIAALEGRG